MSEWRGWDGRGMTPATFMNYVKTLHFSQWRPRVCVVHNTGIPTFAEWHKVPGDRRLRALAGYYRDDQGWSGGPHLFVADDVIWLGTPLTQPGVHSPSWNGISWGVECVGDYDREEMHPAVFQNLASALATLHDALGLLPESLRFHKEDPRTTHTSCPGRHLVKADLIDLINQKLAIRHQGEHLPTRTVA
jgi:hypothetical protein